EFEHPEHAHESEWEHHPEHAHESEWEHPEHAHEYEWEHHPEHAHESEWEHPEHADEYEWEHHEEHDHEYEWEHHPDDAHEFEWEGEAHHEASQEVAHEIAHHEMTHHEALAEMIAASASHEQNEGQAEAMAGAAVVTTLSPRDRRALRRILPDLIRGVAVLTRILRRRRITRPAVRAVPTIVRRTVQTLRRQAAAGQPVTRRAAARAAVTQVQRVLGNPSACAAAIRQNVRATRAMRHHPAAG